MGDLDLYVGHDDDLGSIVVQREAPGRDAWVAWGFARAQTFAWWSEHFGPLVAYGPTAVVLEGPLCPTCGEHSDPTPDSEPLTSPPDPPVLLAAITEIAETGTGKGLLQPGAAFALGCLAHAVDAQPGTALADLAVALAPRPRGARPQR